MVYVFHVDGYEDTELIAPLDMLSRAGIPFTRVGVTGKTITSKLGFTIEADITPEQLNLSDCEMIFLPGGPGTKNYFDKPVIERVRIVEGIACYPCRVNKNRKSVRFSYLIINPLESRSDKRIDIFGNGYFL